MPSKDTAKNENAVEKVKASLFGWSMMAVMSIVLYFVKDINEDVKSLSRLIPVMQLQIEYLQDEQLKTKLRIIPQVPAKHEDVITYDSLTTKTK